MAQPNPYGLSEKDLAKYYRQKCINILEKITKSCFRMFRDPATTPAQLVKRFFTLKAKLDELGEVYLDVPYHSEMRKHVEQLGHTLQGNFDLEEMRGKQMAQLNRLQKLRKSTSYKKEKYKKGVSHINLNT